ncbi:MAG: hypothetical protein KIT84_43990 [Labilithrix sp.]|nr:hypothetical protein [Labilithrix sp.]
MVSACRSAGTRSPATGDARTAVSHEHEEQLRYELDVEIAPQSHELRTVGSFRGPKPRTGFFLNESLAIDELEDANGPVRYRRNGSRIELERPVSAARFRYHGQLGREGNRDFKSRAWVQPGEVRLTEITIWYPVFYEGASDVPWPPEPGTGILSVSSTENLSWFTSGIPIGANRFEFREPSDLVVVGVPFASATYAGRPELRIASPRHEALAVPARSTWDALAGHLGPARTSLISIVEFPATGTTNGLAFLSSNLVVLSSATCNYVVERTPRALRVVAHEMAHRWFGGDLRPVGPGTRWLVESFAEHYAWVVVREQLGDEQLQKIVEETTKQAGEVPTSILALGWEDERVYSAGTLGVRALAERVGQQRLDDVIRRMHVDRVPWSVATLFEELRRSGADVRQLSSFQRDWGLE